MVFIEEVEDSEEVGIKTEEPLVAKAIIIQNGIRNIKVSSLFINIFSIAGSNNQAVAEVLNATKIEKKTARIILFKNFFV